MKRRRGREKTGVMKERRRRGWRECEDEMKRQGEGRGERRVREEVKEETKMREW